jgi:hypothetical protein
MAYEPQSYSGETVQNSGQSTSVHTNGAVVDAAALSNTGTDSSDVGVHRYALIVIGLLGGNLVLLLVLALMGVGLCVHRGRASSMYTPVKVREEPVGQTDYYDGARRYSD